MRLAHHLSLALMILSSVLAVVDADAARFALGERSDEDIVAHCSTLMGGLANVPSDPGRSAVYLEAAELLRLGDTVRSVNNRLLYVLDPSDEDLLTRNETFYRGMPITSVQAFVVKKGGEVVHLDERDARVADEESDERSSSVVIGFPSVEQGDILGWSVILEEDALHGQITRLLVRDAWVAHARFVLSFQEGLGYTARVHNLAQSRSNIDSKKSDKGQPILIDVKARDIPPRLGGAFSPDPQMTEPYVEAALSAIYNSSMKIWIRWDNWNALALGIDSELEDMMQADGRMKDTVKRVCADMSDEFEMADALHRFVRDEVTNVNSWEQRGGRKPARQVLEQGIASPMDKTVLLAGLMRRAGIEARIAYLRNRDLGGFDRDLAGGWQITDTAVFVIDPVTQQAVWYAPGARGAAPRQLPPELRGSEAVVFYEGLEESSDQKWRNAIAQEGYNYSQVYRAYRKSIKAANWHEFFRTPGDPLEIAATLTEHRVLDLNSGTDDVSISSHGLDTWVRRIRGGQNADDVSEEYRDYRGLPGDVEGLVANQVSASGEQLELQWVADPELPPRMGNTWILPPELVFGESLLPFWEGPDRGPIYMSHASVRESTVDVRLPPGATVEGFDEHLTLQNPFFDYESTINVADEVMTIHRRVQFKPGLLLENAMGLLDGDIKKIFAFDTQSLVIKTADAGR